MQERTVVANMTAFRRIVELDHENKMNRCAEGVLPDQLTLQG